MSLSFEIAKYFSITDSSRISDSFIEKNQNLMEIEVEKELMRYIPSYMLWCLKNKESMLIDSYLINALSEYGRCKDPENEYLNFMFRCSKEQRNVISNFLVWCSTELYTVDQTQIERALKNWQQ